MFRRTGRCGQSQRTAAIVWCALALSACATVQEPEPRPRPPAPEVPQVEDTPAEAPRPPDARPPAPAISTQPLPAEELPEDIDAPPPGPPSPPVAPPPPGTGHLLAAEWSALPGWQTDNLGEAWPAFIASCFALQARPEWQKPCLAAAQVRRHDAATLRRFFETHFQPYRVLNADRSASGMVTGYYEPLLNGSRVRSDRFRFPVYGVPDDLLVVELDTLFPELKGRRVRGRIDGRRVVPYFTRGEIDGGQARTEGRELLWVDDPIDAFFLEIQGSGRVRLPDGQTVRIGYADHNGHPYRSIGRVLVERGEMPLSKASMQGIKAWAREHPEQLSALLAENPAFVFFRELSGDASGPLGSLNVPLTPRRSIAVDPATVPLGAPVYLATTWPNSSRPLNRLMVAQDTGAAIKGGVRADFFWGFGHDAGKLAGRMKQSGEMWVLLPREARPNGGATAEPSRPVRDPAR